MILGVLSDTHSNLRNLQAALRLFEARGVQTLLHCGDLTGEDVAHQLDGFRVICVFGNGDIATGAIRTVLLAQDSDNYAGMVYRGTIGGARIAAAHGHVPGIIDELLHSGKFDYVFKGHSHQHEDQRTGFTRLINPGALGGLHREARQVCLVDLEAGSVEFVKIEPENR